jgi:orotidine-5'-phosphate decarboxylase
MKQLVKAKDRLILALDVPTLEEAVALIKELKDDVGMFKVGLELYAHCGTKLFEAMRAEGVSCFFDCKFHDIPNTVARASEGLVGQGIAMFNIHATGGLQMMSDTAAATRKKAAETGQRAPKIIAVTVLTSIGEHELADELGYQGGVTEFVIRLSKLAAEAGLDGVVSSAKEISAIRKACGQNFIIVTPGIRPAWSAADDQKRIVTPKQAVQDGVDYIVVGRPVTQSNDRRGAARRIVEEMES